MLEQEAGIFSEFVVDDVHLMAVEQPEQLFPRSVEREGRGVGDPHAASALVPDHRIEDLAHVVEVHVGQPPVADRDPLGRPVDPDVKIT